jgi:hypothetical protein
VSLREWPDGRTALSVVSQGRELAFARFLTDHERRDLAEALKEGLMAARGGAGSSVPLLATVAVCTGQPRLHP